VFHPLYIITSKANNECDNSTAVYQLQTWNQSIVQQLMSDGYCRSRLRNALPIGLNAMIMCRFSRQRLTKYA